MPKIKTYTLKKGIRSTDFEGNLAKTRITINIPKDESIEPYVGIHQMFLLSQLIKTPRGFRTIKKFSDKKLIIKEIFIKLSTFEQIINRTLDFFN